MRGAAEDAHSWLPGVRFPIRLALFDSKPLFWVTAVAGAVLLATGIGLHFQDSGPEVEGLRWLVFFGCACLSAVIAVAIVEFICPLIEVRYFLALAALPSSWALYKVWLCIVSVYCSFESLWRWSAWGLAPDEEMSTAAVWIERVLLCILVFTSVTMALVILAKILVSQLYGIKHTHKVLLALHQESILADLAACIAPPALLQPKGTAPPPAPLTPALSPLAGATPDRPTPATATLFTTNPASPGPPPPSSPQASQQPSSPVAAAVIAPIKKLITRLPTRLRETVNNDASVASRGPETSRPLDTSRGPLETSRGPETTRRMKIASVFSEAVAAEQQQRAAAQEALPKLGLPRVKVPGTPAGTLGAPLNSVESWNSALRTPGHLSRVGSTHLGTRQSNTIPVPPLHESTQEGPSGTGAHTHQDIPPRKSDSGLPGVVSSGDGGMSGGGTAGGAQAVQTPAPVEAPGPRLSGSSGGGGAVPRTPHVPPRSLRPSLRSSARGAGGAGVDVLSVHQEDPDREGRDSPRPPDLVPTTTPPTTIPQTIGMQTGSNIAPQSMQSGSMYTALSGTPPNATYLIDDDRSYRSSISTGPGSAHILKSPLVSGTQAGQGPGSARVLTPAASSGQASAAAAAAASAQLYSSPAKSVSAGMQASGSYQSPVKAPVGVLATPVGVAGVPIGSSPGVAHTAVHVQASPPRRSEERVAAPMQPTAPNGTAHGETAGQLGPAYHAGATGSGHLKPHLHISLGPWGSPESNQSTQHDALTTTNTTTNEPPAPGHHVLPPAAHDLNTMITAKRTQSASSARLLNGPLISDGGMWATGDGGSYKGGGGGGRGSGYGGARVSDVGSKGDQQGYGTAEGMGEPRGLCGRVADWFSELAYRLVVWYVTLVFEARGLGTQVMMQDAGTVHIRRTLVQALYLVHKLSEKNHNEGDAMQMAAAALRAAHASSQAMEQWVEATKAANKAVVRGTQSAPVLRPDKPPEPEVIDALPVLSPAPSYPGPTKWQPSLHDNPPPWLRLTSPRRLLDSLLGIYAGLTDGDLANMASTYTKLVFASIQPSNPDYISRSDLINIGIDPEGVEMVWELFDKNDNDEMTPDEIKATAITFYQQRRNLALTVRAMRNLTLSIMVAVTLLVNCVFLMVVYLAILDVTYIFGANKTSLDFFSAYILVVSLMFGEMIRNLLAGGVLLLAQQPFDIGEEIIVEEAPSWRYMGVIQDFNLVYLRIKKSTDGELVSIPIMKVATSKFTNLTRSDWKIEQNYYTVDIGTPKDVLQRLTDKALAHINKHPTEYDTDYGFAAFFHGLDKPNKLIIRTFHRYRFNLAAPHRRIARARDGITTAVANTFLEMKISFSEIRLNAPYFGPSMEDMPHSHPPYPDAPAPGNAPPATSATSPGWWPWAIAPWWSGPTVAHANPPHPPAPPTHTDTPLPHGDSVSPHDGHMQSLGVPMHHGLGAQGGTSGGEYHTTTQYPAVPAMGPYGQYLPYGHYFLGHPAYAPMHLQYLVGAAGHPGGAQNGGSQVVVQQGAGMPHNSSFVFVGQGPSAQPAQVAQPAAQAGLAAPATAAAAAGVAGADGGHGAAHGQAGSGQRKDVGQQGIGADKSRAGQVSFATPFARSAAQQSAAAVQGAAPVIAAAAGSQTQQPAAHPAADAVPQQGTAQRGSVEHGGAMASSAAASTQHGSAGPALGASLPKAVARPPRPPTAPGRSSGGGGGSVGSGGGSGPSPLGPSAYGAPHAAAATPPERAGEGMTTHMRNPLYGSAGVSGSPPDTVMAAGATTVQQEALHVSHVPAVPATIVTGFEPASAHT